MLLSPERTEVPLKAKVFKRMKNLKFLVGNVRIGEALEYLPDELRFLEWHDLPITSSSKCCLPQELDVFKMSSKCCLPEELVVLSLSNSNIILEKAFKQV